MTDLERAILDFEARWWQQRGNKEAEIVRRFEMSAIRYAQKLNQILDNPEALAYNPILVNRLRRLRSQRVAARVQRRDLRGQG
ncbi:DUF3263 domain-containing protein [Williamsia sp. DF01-3]|uniref:DUF3263 domain-containing protein n=1 Tax=Williamsia sp. DF01-3 TaxID=2934157 RepID=UPI001FF41B5C|nr:DUF3263 domain-containing protein [Williamsia sp. DF01-3]MCK0517916.1 DUF3263 domain-containing protein [Williamsia sp. DF01-3]